MFATTREVESGEYRAEPGVRLAEPISDYIDPLKLNGDFAKALKDASHATEGRIYQNGINFFGNAEAYNFAASFYGPNSPEASAALQVLKNDMATLILEEVSLKNYFSANYDIKDARAYAAGIWLGEQYARTIVAAKNSPDWMQERFLAEIEEQLSLEQLIASGQMRGKTMVTVSPTPFKVAKSELEKYHMERGFLMIRFLSLDETGTKLNISQIQIPQDLITEEDLRTFLESLEVETNTGECVDGATNILRSSFLMDSVNLGSRANILRALDLHISERAGHPVYCGQKTDIQPNSQQYDKFIVDCMRRYSKFESAINYAVKKITEQSARGGTSPEDVKMLSRDIKERALSLMSDTEIRLNYGNKIADAYQNGGYEGAKSAGLKDNFSSGSCPSSSSSSRGESQEPDNYSFCQRLPKPGEVACCPGCKKMVIVTGTEDNIKCSNGACSLADASSKAAYLAIKASERQGRDSGLIEVWRRKGLGRFFFIKDPVPRELLGEMQPKDDQFALAA